MESAEERKSRNRELKDVRQHVRHASHSSPQDVWYKEMMRKRYTREIRCKQFDEADLLKVSGNTATAPVSPTAVVPTTLESLKRDPGITTTGEASAAKGFVGTVTSRRGL